MQKLARIGLMMIGVPFLAIAVACVVYVLAFGFSIDIGKMYREHQVKQRLQELQKSTPGLTFLEFCQQRKLECTQSIEYGNGYVAQGIKVFYPFWENKTEGSGSRFGWEISKKAFGSEQGEYRSNESFWTAGPKFTSKSAARDIPLPPKEPALPPTTSN